MGQNILKDKSYAFAIMVVGCTQKLIAEKKEYVLSKQLLRSGTASGALVSETEFAQSKLDFINKMSVGLKEANETHYWLSLLKDTNYIDATEHSRLGNACKEIISILVATIKTSKANH